MSTLILFALVVAVLWPLLHRDMKRADERRRRREWMRRPEVVKLALAVEAFKVHIGMKLLPTMRDMVREADKATKSMARLAAVMHNTSKVTRADIDRLAESLRRKA